MEKNDSPWQFSCCILQRLCEGVTHGGDDGLQVLPGVIHHAVTRSGHHVPIIIIVIIIVIVKLPLISHSKVNSTQLNSSQR